MQKKLFARRVLRLVFALTLLFLLRVPAYCQDGSSSAKVAPGTVLRLAGEQQGPVIGPAHPDVVRSQNRSGFETGQVVKLNGVYHMFVNEMFGRPHLDMRIAHWTSTDGIHWRREATVVESIPGRSPSNPRSEVWVTGVRYNEQQDAWNIFYVAYRGGDSTKKEKAGSDYSGRIWRASSVVKGRGGIAGPYADMGIVLEPDENSQYWEGQQAVASFNPYQVGDLWYAFYDGHNHIPRGGWPSGLAKAPRLAGPWTRMPEGINPLSIVQVFMENTVVTHLRDGRYLAVFDSFGDQQIGYSISQDGIHWSAEKRIRVQSGSGIWCPPGDHAMRTPLGAVEEADGTFTVLYTARMKGDKAFYAVGYCKLAWEK